jgi:hypothetical protein
MQLDAEASRIETLLLQIAGDGEAVCGCGVLDDSVECAPLHLAALVPPPRHRAFVNRRARTIPKENQGYG